MPETRSQKKKKSFNVELQIISNFSPFHKQIFYFFLKLRSNYIAIRMHSQWCVPQHFYKQTS